MPAHPQVADADIAKIVDWVMSQKPGECPKEFKKRLSPPALPRKPADR